MGQKGHKSRQLWNLSIMVMVREVRFATLAIGIQNVLSENLSSTTSKGLLRNVLSLLQPLSCYSPI